MSTSTQRASDLKGIRIASIANWIVVAPLLLVAFFLGTMNEGVREVERVRNVAPAIESAAQVETALGEESWSGPLAALTTELWKMNKELEKRNTPYDCRFYARDGAVIVCRPAAPAS